MSLPERIHTLYRRMFGRVSVQDPRPTAEEAPYTFHLPSENERLALDVGDLVKLIVESTPRGPKWAAERMWFTVTRVNGATLSGRLENSPFDMPQLRPGQELRFGRDDVIDIEWSDKRTVAPPSAPQRRWYWERCLVDDCVLSDGALVHYLYREEPDLAADGDSDPDSGWRIRGDYRDTSDDDELDERDTQYVALGAVLNRDDSFIDLIDAPIGAAFIRDWATMRFVAAED